MSHRSVRNGELLPPLVANYSPIGLLIEAYQVLGETANENLPPACGLCIPAENLDCQGA